MNKKAKELAREYRSAGLKPTKIVGGLLQRIAELNPKLNAFTQVFHVFL